VQAGFLRSHVLGHRLNARRLHQALPKQQRSNCLAKGKKIHPYTGTPSAPSGP
jgi:hypothetical protein